MSQPKKPRTKPSYRRRTIEEKIHIIDRLEAGAPNKDLAKEFKVNASTISYIWKNKDNVRHQYAIIQEARGSKSRALAFAPKNLKLDTAMFKWFLQKRSRNEPVSGPLLKRKALTLNALLEGPKDFQASNGWLEKFKNRHGISQKMAHSRGSSADEKASAEFIEFFKTYITDKGYDLDSVYNADETGVHWRSFPREIILASNEDSAAVCKMAKDRVTVMVCANASGTHAIPLMVIGKSAETRCLKNSVKLSVTYRGQKSACISMDLFTEWFTTVFLTSVRGRIGNQKVLLLLDNAPAHPPAQILNEVDDNCEVMYLPPNVTSLIQPMDQGVITSLKRHYKKGLLRELSLQDNQPIEMFTKSFNMLSCCETLSRAWDSVTQETLRNAWSKLKVSGECFGRDAFRQQRDEVQYCVGEVCGYVRNITGSDVVSRENAMAWFEEDDWEFGWEMSTDEQLLNISKDEENEEDLRNEDGTTEERDHPTSREALRGLQTFIEWYQTRCDSEPQDFLALRKVRKVAEDAVLGDILTTP